MTCESQNGRHRWVQADCSGATMMPHIDRCQCGAVRIRQEGEAVTIYKQIEDLEEENRRLKLDLHVLRDNHAALRRITGNCCACKFDASWDKPISDCGFHQAWREALKFYATAEEWDGGFRAREALDE